MRVTQLQQAIRKLETSRRPAGRSASSSGLAALDRLLPEGGFPRGALVEWLASRRGGGTALLMLLAAREASTDGRAIVVLDQPGHFYAPVAAAWGVDLGRLIVVRAGQSRDELWAAEQALRCPAVAAVWLTREQLDWRWCRRLQLAAEQGGGVGLLMRPADVRGQPSWAELQLQVTPCPAVQASVQQSDRADWRLRVELVRCRSGVAGGSLILELDERTCEVRSLTNHHEPSALPVASQLARSATDRRATGA